MFLKDRMNWVGMLGGLCTLILAGPANALIPHFNGFELPADTAEWFLTGTVDSITRVPSGGGTLLYPSASGAFHAEVANSPSDYLPGYGTSVYTRSGGSVTPYAGDFFVALDIYVDTATWGPVGDGFWLDTSPRNVNTGLSDFDAEVNLRFSVPVAGSVQVDAFTLGGNGTVATITSSGWYTFVFTFRKTGNLTTDPVFSDQTIYTASGMELGSTSLPTVMASSDLGGNSYAHWITVWKDGFAGDMLALDNSRTGFLPYSVTRVVDDDGMASATDCDALVPCFSTIQAAINAASPGDTIKVCPGTYSESISVLGKPGLSIIGASAATTTIVGPHNSGGANTVLVISSPGTIIAGFTITRSGNNAADWGSNAKAYGINMSSSNNSVIRDNIITGNRNGLYMENNANATVRNNVIDDNRTGMHLVAANTNCTIVENDITDNWTMGVLFRTESVSNDTTGTIFRNNNISGNWYAQIEYREGFTPMGKNFSGNWLGTTTPVVSNVCCAEPGYPGQIPSHFPGGSATAPGGQPDVRGDGTDVDQFDITPLLESGTDTNVETVLGRGTNGFQGDFSSLTVTPTLAQTGSTGRIQEGIDSVTNSTVHVLAGTYAEQVNINKSVNLLGAQAGVDARTRAVAPALESVIIPDVSSPDPFAGPYIALIYVDADDVTIDGFTLDGDNPSLTSAVNFGGANIDAEDGIAGFETSYDNVLVRNNIIKNLSFTGVDFYPSGTAACTGNQIKQNRVQNMGGDYGDIGILIYNDFYAAVDDNLVEDVATAIQTGNFHLAGSPATISGNEVVARNVGIFHNLHYQNANNFTIANNDVSATLDPYSSGYWVGVIFWSIQTGVSATFTNNTIDGSLSTELDRWGYDIWNLPTTATPSISGGSVSGVGLGMQISNFQTSWGSGQLPGTDLLISGVDISASDVGIWVEDSASNTNGSTLQASITGDTNITSAGTGILVSGANASASITNNDNSINGNLIGIDVDGGSATITTNHIYDNGTGIRFTNGGTGSVTGNDFDDDPSTDGDNGTDLRIDSTAGSVTIGAGNSFAGDDYFIDNKSSQAYDLTANSTTYDEANPFRIEDKMYHALDAGASGRIEVIAGQWYVTTPGTGLSDETIQRGVNAADPGDTVNVEAGTYNEDVTITSKAGLSVLGAGAATTTIIGPHNAGLTRTFEVQSSPNTTVAGFTITRNGNNCTDWAGNQKINGLLVSSSNNSLIRDNIITGNRNGLYMENNDGVTVRNNVIDNNRTGLHMVAINTNCTVTENDITNNWTMGVLFRTESVSNNTTGSVFSNNNISGNWYAQIEYREDFVPLGKNFSGNWLGTTTPVISAVSGGEPGYAAQIPVMFCAGGATPPGGQPDIKGNASANFDVTPWLNLGTDTDVETVLGRGTNGFQGDYSNLTVTTQLAQTGLAGRITEGVAAIADGSLTGGARILHVLAGTYADNADTTSKPMTLAPGASPAQVTVNGNMALDSNDTLNIELEGVMASTQYDNFIVNGTVTLGNAVLNATRTFNRASNTQFIIIDNDGNDPVNGTFFNMPEGSVINVSGADFTISYVGGDGNDVVLYSEAGTLQITYDDSCYIPGTQLVATIKMKDLTEPAAGFQAFLQYDTSRLTFVSYQYTCDPFGNHIINGNPNVNPAPGLIDVAAGIRFLPSGPPCAGGAQPTSAADADLVYLTFNVTGGDACPGTIDGLLTFRPNSPPTRLTDIGGQPLALLTLQDSNPITIDGTPPSITCSAGMNLQCASAIPAVNIASVTASDTCSAVTVTHVGDVDSLVICENKKTVTRTYMATDECGNTATCDQVFVINDNTLPVVTCPADVNVTPAAGDCSNIILNASNFIASATDNCTPPTPAPTIVGVRQDNMLDTNNPAFYTTPWPNGTTQVIWTATDACGNVSLPCSQYVTVYRATITVAVELSPTIDDDQNPDVLGSLTRCITFEVWTCSPNTMQTTSLVMTFTDDEYALGLHRAKATGTICVPATVPSNISCVTARDRLHTLRSRVTDALNDGLTGSGQYFAADFTGTTAGELALLFPPPTTPGPGHRLVCGNLNDDIFIDILDFGTWAGQYDFVPLGPEYATGNTTCSTLAPHSDISGDGHVDSGDFSFFALNFLLVSQNNCCSAFPITAPDDDDLPVPHENPQPITSISVKKLFNMGLGHMAAGDVNGDGMLDQLDVQAVFNGQMPAPPAGQPPIAPMNPASIGDRMVP